MLKINLKSWSSERGTFWVFEAAGRLPAKVVPRSEVGFAQVEPADFADLAEATGSPSPEVIQRRFKGDRRCYYLASSTEITCYGWVSFGSEYVGELERTFHLQDEEAYIWDCLTMPAWRGQRMYTALLSHILFQLYEEGVPRIWIGASRQNLPSIKGIASAGFQHVLDLGYMRLFGLTLLRFRLSPEIPDRLSQAAYRILLQASERRFGPLALGWRS